MRWLLLSCVLGSVVGAGCGKTVYRSYESHYCSSSDDDDPYFECSKSSDLVCIYTYDKSYGQTDGKPDKVVSMWACREACDPAVKNPCVNAEEVCCPGMIFGRNYGKDHACVMRDFCDAFVGMKDAGAKPDASKPDAGAGTPDAAGPDAAAGGTDASPDSPAD
jgi:hypothetical protein